MDVRLLTLENVAEYLHLHPSTIYRMLKKNQLAAFKFGREWRFNRESIDGWRADAEHNVTTRTQRIPLADTDTSAQVKRSHRASSSPAGLAHHLESTSEAERPAWSGWPRLTDP